MTGLAIPSERGPDFEIHFGVVLRVLEKFSDNLGYNLLKIFVLLTLYDF